MFSQKSVDLFPHLQAVYWIFFSHGRQNMTNSFPTLTKLLTDSLVSLLLNDFLFYWFHRIEHMPYFYKTWHKQHRWYPEGSNLGCENTVLTCPVRSSSFQQTNSRSPTSAPPPGTTRLNRSESWSSPTSSPWASSTTSSRGASTSLSAFGLISRLVFALFWCCGG